MGITLQPVSFTVDAGARGKLTLRGTAYLPEGFDPSGAVPVAVLMHGFGGDRIDFSCFIVQLGRALAERGVAAVAYDRAGHGESDGEFFDTTIWGDVEDAMQVIDAVRHMDGIDPDNLHLAGLSFGSVIATYLAPRLAAPPRSMALCSIAASYVDEFHAGRLQGKPLDPLYERGYFDFMGMALGPAMAEEAKDGDVYRDARGYDGPVLFIHGTDDFIPVSYVEGYREVYGDMMETMIIDGGEHGFGNVEHRRVAIPRAADFIAEYAHSKADPRRSMHD